MSTRCSPRARARALDHEHGVGRQSVRAVGRILNEMRNPSGIFFNLCVGLYGPGCLHMLGMPPRGYLTVFATLNPQSTCHGPRPGPTLAPWCSGGPPACPAAESTSKEPRPQEKKNVGVQKKTHVYSSIHTRSCCLLLCGPEKQKTKRQKPGRGAVPRD